MIKKTLIWLFWLAWYKSFSAPEQMRLAESLEMLKRTRSPWWKFKPAVIRDCRGAGWEVHLREDATETYTQYISLPLEFTVDSEGNLYSVRISATKLERIRQSIME